MVHSHAYICLTILFLIEIRQLHTNTLIIYIAWDNLILRLSKYGLWILTVLTYRNHLQYQIYHPFASHPNTSSLTTPKRRALLVTSPGTSDPPHRSESPLRVDGCEILHHQKDG